jgi:hypothetical protein
MVGATVRIGREKASRAEDRATGRVAGAKSVPIESGPLL